MSNVYDYALLLTDANRDARAFAGNQAPIPPGWTELTQYAVSGSGEGAQLGGSGFSARVYRNGSEIVISYAGTQFWGGSARLSTTDLAVMLIRLLKCSVSRKPTAMA